METFLSIFRTIVNKVLVTYCSVILGSYLISFTKNCIPCTESHNKNNCDILLGYYYCLKIQTLSFTHNTCLENFVFP